MRTLGLRSLSFAAACVAALATLRCNAVLGIEEAQVDPTFAADGTGGNTNVPNYSGTNLPIGCIEPVSGCRNCLKSCPMFNEQRCFANANCRKVLDDYRVCLGDSCTGVDKCREEVLYMSSDPDVKPLVGCLGETCASECGEKPLYTQCELYCACMDHNCVNSLPVTGADCVSACMADPNTFEPDIAYCRKAHCEFAVLSEETAIHCGHAAGMGACSQKPVNVDNCSKTFPDFPCKEGSECCTGSCNTSREVCD